MNNSGGALSFDAVIRNTDFKRQLDSMEQQLKGFGSTAEKEGEKMESAFKGAGTAIAAFFVLSKAQQFISKMIQVRGEFQQLEIGLKTMLGSKEKADKLFAQMVDLAAKTPFTLSDVGAAGKMLIAYGTSAEIVTEKLRQLGDIAAGTNAPLQDLVYLYGTSRTQGRLFQRDILQFAGRGVPIFTELAKVMGVTEKEVTGLVSAGKVGFEELDQVIVNLTSDGGMFFNLMKEQSSSVTGQLSNLEDAFDVMLNTLGESSQGFIYTGISATTVLIENYEKIGKIIMELVVIYGSYRAALIVLNTIEAVRTGLIMAQATSTRTVTLATYLYTAALAKLKAMQIAIMGTNPYGWVALAVAGIAGLIGYLKIFADESDDASRAAAEHAKAIEKVNQQLDKETAKVSVLVSTARNEAMLRRTRTAALKELKSVSDGWLDNLTLENIKTKEGIGILEDYNNELRRSITLKGNEDEMVATITRMNEIARKKEELQSKINKVETRIGTQTGRTNEYKPLDDTWEKRRNVLLDEHTKLMTEETALTLHLKSLENDRLKIASEQGKKAEEVNATDKLTIAQIDEQIKKHKEDLELVKEGEKVQYDKIQAEIKALEDRKKAITGGTEKNKNKAESDALKGEMKLYSEHLENKKRLYELYERWVSATGEKAANEQFSVLLKSGASYSDWISGEITRITNIKNKTSVELEQLKALTESLAGEQLADEDAQLDRFKNNISERLDLIVESQKKISYLEDEMNKIPLTGEDNIKKRLVVFELLKSIQHSEAVAQANHLRNLQKDYQTAEDKKEEIIREGEKDITALIASGYLDRASLRRKQMNQDLNDVDESIKKLQEKFEKNDTDFSSISIKMLKNYQNLLRVLLLDPSIAENVKAQISNNLNIIQTEIDKKAGNAYTKYLAAREKYKKAMKLGGEEAALAHGALIKAEADLRVELSSTFSKVSGGLTDLASLAGTFNKELEQVLNTAADIAGGLSQIASGDYFGGATKIGAAIISSIVNAKAAEQERIEAGRLELLEKQRDVLNEINASIARQVALTDQLYGSEKAENYMIAFEKIKTAITDSLLAIDSMIITVRKLNSLEVNPRTGEYIDWTVLKESLDDYITTYNEMFLNPNYDPREDPLEEKWLHSGQSVVQNIQQLIDANSAARLELWNLLGSGTVSEEEAEQLRVMLEALDEQSEQFEQLKDQYSQYITGSTFTGIVDSIADGFAAGKDSAADFADNFEELMKKALLQALKMKSLEPQIAAWYDSFVAFSGDSEGLSIEEIEELRRIYNEIITGAGEQWEALNEILNGSSIGGFDTSLTGAIKGVSEETASLIAGQMNAMRLNQSEMISTFEQQLIYQAEIASNTRFLSLLVSINDKIGATPNPGEI